MHLLCLSEIWDLERTTLGAVTMAWTTILMSRADLARPYLDSAQHDVRG
jgi:hypothetical protein